MQQALSQARNAWALGEVPVGAVVVKDGQVIATGFNQPIGTHDPTAHAEIVAILAACQALDTFSLAGCDIYTSCEPCPMCLAAIYWARLDRVYYANTRTDAAAIGFDDDHLYREVAKELGKREMPFIRLDSVEAARVFREWV